MQVHHEANCCTVQKFPRPWPSVMGERERPFQAVTGQVTCGASSPELQLIITLLSACREYSPSSHSHDIHGTPMVNKSAMKFMVYQGKVIQK